MVRLATLVLVICCNTQVQSQVSDSAKMDLVDLFVPKKNHESVKQYRANKRVHFSLLPAAVNVPGGGKAVITAVNAAFYLGNPTVTNLSNIYIVPYTNFTNRYGLYVRPNIWLSKNRFNIVGDYRIAHFPQYSWGLGGNSPGWDESLIDSDYIRFYQTLLAHIFHYWYAGAGYVLDHHYNISESDYLGEGHLSRYEEPVATHSTSSGVTANLVFDSRKNAINPPKGAYLLLTWRWNQQALGSTYTNSSLYIEGRKYFRLTPGRDNILALRSYYWTVLNGKTPYLDLPATNWQPSSGVASRGFQTGRYRSNAMMYAEGEQRLQITDNGLFGAVAFMNVSSASEYETQHFKYWKVGGGFGLRAKFNKYSNTNIAIDFGFSHDYWGVWLNIGEFF